MVTIVSAAGCAGRPASATYAESQVADASACPRPSLTDGLDLVVLGSGGPRSAGRAASSYLVSAGGVPRVLIDAGSGSFARLGETGLDAATIDTVLFTHLHIDHAADLPGIVKSRDLWGKGPVRFRIVGPAGRQPYPSTSEFVDRLFGSEGAFAYLPSFRNELQIDTKDLPVSLDDAPRQALALDGGVTISSVAVDHGDVPAVAYRIQRGRASIVVSGDLASKRTKIVDLARGADILVYDAAVLDPPGSPPNLYELHTPPKRIGEVARAAGVRTLILSHIPPAVEPRKGEVLASVRRAFEGDVRFARDCMHLPAAGGEE